MQIIIKETNQTALLLAIAKWQESIRDEDYTIFIEAIMFFPFYNGNVTAIINYREADGYSDRFVVSKVEPSYGATTEKQVFSAMQGGTDGG